MRYVKAKYKTYIEDLAYRIYISDTLYYSSRNMAINERFKNLIMPPEKDERTGDEIAKDVITKLGLKVE